MAAVGVLRGAGWSWTLGIIASIIFIIIGGLLTVLGFIGLTLGNIRGVIFLIPGLPTTGIASTVLITLLRPHVKEYFGKGSPGRV